MKKFDIGNAINTILNDFGELDKEDTLKVLEWFYKNKLFRTMYEKEEIREFILTSLNYVNNEDHKKHKEIFDKIYGNKKLSKDDENYLLQELLNDIDNFELIRPATYKLLETYIELNDLYFANDLMRERLENNQHNKAKLKGYYNGERIEVEDIISNYVPYQSVTLGSVVYPFIGPNVAVTEIISSTGEMLYQNLFIPLNYNMEDERDIEKLRRKKFGLDRDENV